MITAVDTNVFVALWNRDDSWNRSAETALDSAFARGGLVICAPVYSELLALPGRTEAFLDSFFSENSVLVDWELEERVWRAAARAFQSYTANKKGRAAGPRRILADFLIGAHALEKKCPLLTFDQGIFEKAFPGLKIVSR